MECQSSFPVNTFLTFEKFHTCFFCRVFFSKLLHPHLQTVESCKLKATEGTPYNVNKTINFLPFIEISFFSLLFSDLNVIYSTRGRSVCLVRGTRTCGGGFLRGHFLKMIREEEFLKNLKKNSTELGIKKLDEFLGLRWKVYGFSGL